VALDESKYEDKFNTLLECGDYELLPKDPTAKVERKLQELLSKHNTVFLKHLKHKMTWYHSKPPRLYSLSKVHKPDIRLRPIVSSVGSPWYAQASFLHTILSPLAQKSESAFKNSGHCILFLQSVNLHSLDTVASFDAVSLFTNAAVNKAQHLMSDKLNNEDTLAERSDLQIEANMDLLEVCLPNVFSWMISSSNRNMAWLWGTLCHPSLATYIWSILRNWLLTRHNINHCCGSITLMTFSWSGVMPQRGYKMSSATTVV
jgi:hypothetical protein